MSVTIKEVKDQDVFYGSISFSFALRGKTTSLKNGMYFFQLPAPGNSQERFHIGNIMSRSRNKSKKKKKINK